MGIQHYHVESYKARSSIGYQIKRAAGLISDKVDPSFAAHGFTLTQWVVLMHLRDGIALNAKNICGELRHDSGALTRVLDQLAERGLIERQRSLTDRRRVDLSLTEAGREIVEKLMPIIVDGLNAALVDFSAAEFAEFTRLLIKFNAGMAGETP